jgi:outer membrane protein
MRPLLCSVGLAVCPVLAVCQSPVPASLTLADAIALARANNPTYRQAIHDRAPAAWQVRTAWASLLAPTVTASGGLGYAGPGQQTFLTSSFSQNVSTWSSNYGFNLAWTLSGQTLTQPGLRKAQLNAADADVLGAETSVVNAVTQEYLTVLQARDNAEVARQQLQHDEEFLKLAQARYDVGRASLIDVRQAQVALLRARTAVQVEKLRLFQAIGVAAPLDIASVQLSDSFPVQTPTWRLAELLALAEQQNPPLKALRERERAAGWGVRAAATSYGPALSLSAGWSGFTQKLSDLTPSLAAIDANTASNDSTCRYANSYWLNSGLPPLTCGIFATQAATQKQALRTQNSAYPYRFTPQPFQARLTVSIPLWGDFQQPLLVSQAKAQQQDLEESVRARGPQVQTEVSQAFLQLETAYQAIAIQDTNRIRAREQLQLATERYRVGSGTFFELLDAQVAALRAETDYVSAVYDYHKALAALEAAVGRPLR